MATKVLLDANVLFRALIRDTLLRAGEAGLLQVHWSPEILDETGKSLAENKKLNPKQVESLLRAIKTRVSRIHGHGIRKACSQN